jgi:replicative DNA helicase
MTAVALARRMALEHTGLPAWVFDATGAVEARWETARTEAVQRIATEVRNLPIYIHDASRPTTAAMRQAFHRHGPFDLVLFDYTSLSGDAVRSDSEERRMAEIALNLQQFARDCAVPVIALHQLSRAVEHASPFRPAMAHLRDSGQVEANAHVVLLLYRRQYYVDQGRMDPDPALEHVLEINVAKNRDGETGIVPLHFDGTTSRIREQRRI